MQKNHTILLVDDDPDDQFLFREALCYADDSADFISVNNGEEALKFLLEARTLPNVLFLDLNMPVMYGQQCLNAIRENTQWASLPVIIYSTTVAQDHARLLKGSGATAVIQKPNDFMALCTVIETFLLQLGL